MNDQMLARRMRLLGRLACALPVIAVSIAAADHPKQTVPDPGYLPEGYFVATLVEDLPHARIAVLPTMIRRPERTAHSFESQKLIIAHLSDNEMIATRKAKRINPGPLRRQSQWEIFQHGADTVTESIGAYSTETEYVLVMEILVPDPQAVFGIEVYLVDRHGNHVLSFLLNEHHRMFADAKLFARNSSEDARNEMVAKATKVGLAAFEAQLSKLREHVLT